MSMGPLGASTAFQLRIRLTSGPGGRIRSLSPFGLDGPEASAYFG